MPYLMAIVRSLVVDGTEEGINALKEHITFVEFISNFQINNLLKCICNKIPCLRNNSLKGLEIVHNNIMF